MSEPVNKKELFWTKIGFCVFAFLESFISGIFPTLSASCRESPKILGIANSFAAGVFMAIAIIHIAPEIQEKWNEHSADKAKPFPLPSFLMVMGYTLILIIDKVLFDTHALFEEDGEHGHEHEDATMNAPERKFMNNLRASFANVKEAEITGNTQNLRAS